MIRRSLSSVLALVFSGPLLAATEGQQTLFNFVRPADVVQITTQDASLPQSNAEQTAEGEVLRRVTFNPVARPSLRLAPESGSWNWSDDSSMTLRVQSAMDWALTLDVQIQSADGSVINSRVDLPAGPAQTVFIPLNASSPLSQGMFAGPPMPWTYDGQRVLLADAQGKLDRSKVVSVTLSMNQPDVAQSILLERFGVQEGDVIQKAAYANIVDGYGQFTRSKWPEKVVSDEQLKAASVKEHQQLKTWLADRPKQDKYGGWLGGPSFEAKGFFRTEKLNGRWYLITPEGHPFYSLGVNAVTAADSRTYVEGRESMFSALPTDVDPLAIFYGKDDNRRNAGANGARAFAHGKWFDFYGANLQRTNGQEKCVSAVAADQTVAAKVSAQCASPAFDAKRWTAHTLDRLQAWGFNTIGNWSDPELGVNERVPYTLPLSIVGDYNSISTGVDRWGGMPDPFDPRFAMATERAVAIAARDHRDDPWLVGYFADNELAWAGDGNDPKSRYALAYGTLKMSTDAPAKRAFLKQLRDKYRNRQGLSKAWGIDLPAWELLEDPGFQPPLPSADHPEIEADFKNFQKAFADTYFKTISDSLKWHAPNHLLLGGRFSVSTPEAVASCAQYCDVLSFNFYTLKPQDGYDFAKLRELDKPVLIGEFHFGSRDRGPFWAGAIEVPREEDRGPAYANFLKQALAEPSIVGVHWFEYVDQPVTGRLLDGENGHVGLVGITDVPFQGFVEAVRKANVQVPVTLNKETRANGADKTQAHTTPLEPEIGAEDDADGTR
ncbi:beta-galactosidase [Pseudomonas sp. CCI1.2]|uniref:beta-galactosidase n=1 Tax=Pseudomonas sp. CCI1.2 TaxID=3048614 RepID=UPI002B234D2E|nr:beta-galactosidase [Pseudomonas sp. CCI1.2]MEB0122720.1 beta-galactosidase [Pseudomonas sp. CCI1.2]